MGALIIRIGLLGPLIIARSPQTSIGNYLSPYSNQDLASSGSCPPSTTRTACLRQRQQILTRLVLPPSLDSAGTCLDQGIEIPISHTTHISDFSSVVSYLRISSAEVFAYVQDVGSSA